MLFASKLLAAGGSPRNLPATFTLMNSLSLADVEFGDFNVFSCTICLIQSCPNLKKLTFWVWNGNLKNLYVVRLLVIRLIGFAIFSSFTVLHKWEHLWRAGCKLFGSSNLHGSNAHQTSLCDNARPCGFEASVTSHQASASMFSNAWNNVCWAKWATRHKRKIRNIKRVIAVSSVVT